MWSNDSTVKKGIIVLSTSIALYWILEEDVRLKVLWKSMREFIGYFYG